MVGAILFYFLSNNGLMAVEAVSKSQIHQGLGGLDHGADTRHGGLSAYLGIFPQHDDQGGLFTGLFVGAMKLGDVKTESDEEPAPAEDEGADEAAVQNLAGVFQTFIFQQSWSHQLIMA